MDYALAIDKLVPAASYGGSLTANTEAAYNALRWNDERAKPTLAELEVAWSLCLRDALRIRVSADYDQKVLDGFPISVSWSADPLIIVARDVELLSGMLATAGALLALGQITQTSPVIASYTFGDGTTKTGIQFDQLAELNLTYQQTRSARYLAHKSVKDALDAGSMPQQADYEACGLTLESFEGCNLS